jgi:hypothetical protein
VGADRRLEEEAEKLRGEEKKKRKGEEERDGRGDGPEGLKFGGSGEVSRLAPPWTVL